MSGLGIEECNCKNWWWNKCVGVTGMLLSTESAKESVIVGSEKVGNRGKRIMGLSMSLENQFF